MTAWTIPRALAGLVIVLAILEPTDTPSPPRDLTGFWVSNDITLSIVREGEHQEYYVIQWKEPTKADGGGFGVPFRPGTLIVGDHTLGEIRYMRRHLVWQGQEFRLVDPKDYGRAAPRIRPAR